MSDQMSPNLLITSFFIRIVKLTGDEDEIDNVPFRVLKIVDPIVRLRPMMLIGELGQGPRHLSDRVLQTCA
jgi:hypothetical protein